MKEFKLIVAGGRDFDDYELLDYHIRSLADNELSAFNVSIVSGMARGADNLGYTFAQRNSIQVYKFPADWSLGRAAGHIRNRKMGDFADGLLAFWDGQSRGTKGMIEYMQSLKKPVYLHGYNMGKHAVMVPLATTAAGLAP